MKLVVAKVNENVFDGEALSVTLPGASGEMTVLPEHMPVITTLKPGIIVVRSASADGSGETRKTFTIQSGILEVRPDGATVIL